VTDVGDEMCWWQCYIVSNSFGHFGHQHPLCFYISVGQQHSNNVTNILNLSPTLSYQHHNVTNITVTRYRWRMFETVYLGCKFKKLTTDSLHLKNHYKNDSVTNVIKLLRQQFTVIKCTLLRSKLCITFGTLLRISSLNSFLILIICDDECCWKKILNRKWWGSTVALVILILTEYTKNENNRCRKQYLHFLQQWRHYMMGQNSIWFQIGIRLYFKSNVLRKHTVQCITISFHLLRQV